MRTVLLRSLAIMAMLASFVVIFSNGAHADEPQCVVNPGNGAKMCEGGFYGYWEFHGGLPVFGYPITDPIWLQDQGRTIQYTERQRFESHPENQPPYHVLLGLLGAEEAQARGLTSQPAFQPAAQKSGDEVMFSPETGHNVTNEHGFFDYWHSHGLEFEGSPSDPKTFAESLALFGYPISEEFVDPDTGYTTQYFQRAVFEWHPENAGTQYEVLLKLVGVDKLKRDEANTCNISIAAGQTAHVTAGCIVIGDVEVSVNGGPREKLYDSDSNTGLVVVADHDLDVYAQWGASVTSGSPDDIAAQQRAHGCGGSGCQDVIVVHR